jgi:hypothetical protein
MLDGNLVSEPLRARITGGGKDTKKKRSNLRGSFFSQLRFMYCFWTHSLQRTTKEAAFRKSESRHLARTGRSLISWRAASHFFHLFNDWNTSYPEPSSEQQHEAKSQRTNDVSARIELLLLHALWNRLLHLSFPLLSSARGTKRTSERKNNLNDGSVKRFLILRSTLPVLYF